MAFTVRVLLGEPETNDNADVVLPSQMPKLPPIAGDPIYEGRYLPATNGTYGLTLMPVDESKRVKEVWLHKVTMTIPGRTPDEMLRVGASMGFTNSGRGDVGSVLRNGDAVLAQTPWHRGGPAGYAIAEGQKLWNLQRGDYDAKWWKEDELTNHYEFAKAEMQKLGMWPDYARDDWPKSREYREIDPGRDETRQFDIFGGNIEGAPLMGRYILHITILRTKHLARADGRLCRTQRYAKVKTKSIEQAFDELNKGYGSLIHVQSRGVKVKYYSLGYVSDGISGDWMIPVYMFGNLYIPAMESEYFEDPTRQVVAEGMLSKAKDGKMAVDPAKVAALRFDPDEYIARVRAQEKAACEQEAIRIVEEAYGIVIGRLERGKVAGEWEVKAEQTVDFTNWFWFLSEYRLKQLKGPVLLSALSPARTNAVDEDAESLDCVEAGQIEMSSEQANVALESMADRGRVIVIRKRFHDEVWSEQMVSSWRYVPEMESDGALLDTLGRFRLPRRNLLSSYPYDRPNGAFYRSAKVQLESVLKAVEDVKKRHDAAITELRSKAIDERIQIAKRGEGMEDAIKIKWCLTALVKDPEVRVRRELASSRNPRYDIILYLLEHDPDEEVRVRAKSAYEKNYGKLLPRKEDKNHK
jgi:hypothetical protein